MKEMINLTDIVNNINELDSRLTKVETAYNDIKYKDKYIKLLVKLKAVREKQLKDMTDLEYIGDTSCQAYHMYEFTYHCIDNILKEL